MRVSIVVPVYNVEAYIERCYNSIVKQTYRDIECIFVDDASPDNCYDYLIKRIEKYEGDIEFKLCRHPVNKGIAAARNTGTLVSSGEYIYYIDSDDEITENCIEDLVDLVKKYPDVDMVQGNTKTIPEPAPERDWRNIIYKDYPEYSGDNCWIKKQCFDSPRIPVNAWNKLIKKQFMLDNNLFFKEGVVHEDEHWIFFVSKKIQSIAFTVKYCYLHYVVPGSIMQSGCHYKRVKSMLVILEELLKSVDDVHSESQRRYIYGMINSKMIKALSGGKEKELLEGYYKLVRETVGGSFFALSIVDYFVLSVFLSPVAFYRSRYGQKLLYVLMGKL
jgi:glycosyltransferase involved in cell wall biosynthesis